jgi:hypothetical protein
MPNFSEYTDGLHVTSFLLGATKNNEDVKAEFAKLRDIRYPGKVNTYCQGPDAQHEHIVGEEWLRRLQACLFGIWTPPAEIVLANLGLNALPAPGYEWIDGPETGMRLLMKHGVSVYQFLYETLPHFESCPSQFSLIAAHAFCYKHDENFVEWLDRSTGNRMFYAASGGYYEKAMSMEHDNHVYIPPITGVYGFKNARKPTK